MTNYVPIYVPAARYPDALRQVSSLLTTSESPTPAEPHEAAAPPSEGRSEWDDDLWPEAWPTLSEQSRTLLVFLAEHGGEWVGMAALDELFESHQAAMGALSSLVKRTKPFFGGRKVWPFDLERDEETGRYMYRMTKATASIVLSVARGERRPAPDDMDS